MWTSRLPVVTGFMGVVIGTGIATWILPQCQESQTLDARVEQRVQEELVKLHGPSKVSLN